ncbi:MAG: phosphatidate cytidylyltransferase [Bacteroidaceae bacterium]|nr:phosphatidate cytidylyltransferase [Bacteroidaceae bacterium]
MKKLLVRVATGAVFGIVLLASILYNNISFGALFALVTCLAVNEFCNLVHEYKKTTFSTMLAVVGGMYLFFAMFMLDKVTSPFMLFVPYLMLIVYNFIRELYKTDGSALDNFAYFALSQLYAALPFAMLNILTTFGGAGYNYIMPLSIFIFLWCSDSGAYFVGSAIGRRKLFERISPKKSWEGSIGGGVLALVAAYILSIYHPMLSTMEWMGMAIVVVVTGTWGDLIESCMKREMGIKDSGNILPGHGGILDRFDSAMLAIPSVAVYLYFLEAFNVL